ncbi:hypothetical protein, partial [Sporolactobacillus vineae]|uniref:hypothetical protein n=1 Tax=Sporolactobacillus vineae TaxID=444463 RepID=UPI001EE64D11
MNVLVQDSSADARCALFDAYWKSTLKINIATHLNLFVILTSLILLHIINKKRHPPFLENASSSF